jgi:hypothetical protein
MQASIAPAQINMQQSAEVSFFIRDSRCREIGRRLRTAM